MNDADSYYLHVKKDEQNAIKLNRYNANTFPKSWSAHINLARALQTNGKLVAAIKHIESAIGMFKSDSEGKYKLKQFRVELTKSIESGGT